METLSWTTREYTHRPKRKEWFIAAGLVLLTGIVLSIIAGNILFAVVLVLGGILGYVFADKEPKEIMVALDGKGITVDDQQYPFRTMMSFGVLDEQEGRGQQKIVMHVRRAFAPFVVIPVADDLDIELIREYMAQFVAEETHEEPWSHRLADRLGF